MLATKPSWSQEMKGYNLPAVVQTALTHHPSLRGTGAQVDAAKARARQGRAGYAPKLAATLGYTALQDAPSFTIPAFGGAMVYGDKDNRQASVTMQFPLYTGGKLQGANKQAWAGVQASESVHQRQRQKVVLDATITYHNLLKAREMVKVSEDQLKALQSQHESISKMVDRGVATRIDRLRCETAVAAAEEMLTRARNGESISLSALANSMGLPANAELKVVETSGADLNSEVLVDQSAAIEEAWRRRPELSQMTAHRAGAEAGEKVAKGGQRPSLGLFAQYDAERPTFLPETGNWSAGVMLTMNLFDGGATKADVARARAEIVQSEAVLEELHNGISLEVTQSLLNLRSSRDRVTTTEKGASAAAEALRLVALGYQNGVNTITDLLAAQAELTKAQTDRVAAEADLHTAEAELRFALGRDM